MPAYRLYIFISIIHKRKLLSERLKAKMELMEHLGVDVDETMSVYQGAEPCYNFKTATDIEKMEYVFVKCLRQRVFEVWRKKLVELHRRICVKQPKLLAEG